MIEILRTDKVSRVMTHVCLIVALALFVELPKVGMAAMYLLPGVIHMQVGRGYAGYAWVMPCGTAPKRIRNLVILEAPNVSLMRWGSLLLRVVSIGKP